MRKRKERRKTKEMRKKEKERKKGKKRRKTKGGGKSMHGGERKKKKLRFPVFQRLDVVSSRIKVGLLDES